MSENAKDRVERFEKGSEIDEYLKDTIKTTPDEVVEVPEPDDAEDFEVSEKPEKIEDSSYKDFL